MISFLQNQRNSERIDIMLTDASAVQALVSTHSFSGKKLYWLHGVHNLPIKKQQEWLEYLRGYKGPHTLLLHLALEHRNEYNGDTKTWLMVTVPETIAAHDYPMIRFLTHPVTKTLPEVSPLFIQQMSFVAPTLSLDEASLLALYEPLLGANIATFFDEWVPYLLKPNHSLFLLSQYFFSKKSKYFFKQWSYCHEHYMPTFWAMYWEDQLWRAYIYCDLMRQKKFTEAKKAQYKLPFSLVNRDWNSLHLSELEKAHQFVATMDFKLKNGASPVALELFYGLFFNGTFR
jgi:hypothetical protein